MARLCFGSALLLVVGLLCSPMAAAEPPEQTSYTKAELAALDRALEAANLNRRDLTFCKDLAEGHAALALVREMLHDPMTIAPAIDGFVRDGRAGDKALHAPLGMLMAAHDRVPHSAALCEQVTGEPYQVMHSILQSGARVHPAPKATPDSLLAHLEHMASVGSNPIHLTKQVDSEESEPLSFEDVRYRILRRYLPEQMAWHEVFKSPYTEGTDKTLAKILEGKGESHLHDLGARISVTAQIHLWLTTFRDPVAWLKALPAESFPKDKPLVKETPYGRIALGTAGDDVYTGEFAALIDPGGNDRYVDCRLGAAYGTKDRRVGFFADLGGHDVYDCAEVNVTLGAAVLGVAAFLDLGAGNDRYMGGHASLGAAMGGVAVFYDDGGSDTYDGRTFTQGAAGFGVGIFQDDGVQSAARDQPRRRHEGPRIDPGLFDNDRLRAWSCAQAFARCRGVAVCLNARGNDVYEAGGIYLHAPLFADRYQSFSQGFAIGERGVDYAGGIALIADLEGNDRYLGDIYNQGVGYWYSAGLLYDGGGNDLYEMTQYGQGSGIHLAVGGTGGRGGPRHVRHARGPRPGRQPRLRREHPARSRRQRSLHGHDLVQRLRAHEQRGAAHRSRSGNDTYAGRKGSINSGRPARGFASVGVLVDLQGKDHYLGIMKDETTWRHSDLGVGVDLEPAPKAAGDTSSKPAIDEPTVEIPAICSYEGELTTAVFDELWAIAIRWQVGENRHIVPKARARLVAFGKPVLSHLDRAMDKGASGLELRAYKDVLDGLRKAGAGAEVAAFLNANLKRDDTHRRKVALWLAGEMKAREAEAAIVALLDVTKGGLDRRAAGALQRVGSHAGDEALLAWIADGTRELRVMAALGTLLGLDTACYTAVRSLLDHPLISVRSRLATLLAGHDATYGKAVRAELGAKDLGERARRTVLDVLARTKALFDAPTLEALSGLLESPSWGVRADAARALRRQLSHEDLPGDSRAAIEHALSARRAVETDAYARFWMTER